MLMILLAISTIALVTVNILLAIHMLDMKKAFDKVFPLLKKKKERRNYVQRNSQGTNQTDPIY